MRKSIHAGRLLRRSAALFLTTLGVWALLLCTGGGPRKPTASGESAAALAAEPRPADPAQSGSHDLLTWLLTRQSSLLRSNPAPGPGIASPSPSPTPSPDLPAGQPAQDRDDVAPSPAVTTAPETIIERTLLPTSGQGYVCADGLYLYNRTGHPVDLAAAIAAPVKAALPAEGPQILIIHTHATEAYTPDGTDTYEPSDPSRTVNTEQNMVRVGDELERIYTEMGLRVIHDRTLYDYPQYNGCYKRSGAAVERWLEQYPSLAIVLDIHRDALVGENGTVYKAVTTIDGVKTAQVMLVVGAEGDGVHPHWAENLALATRLQRSMNTLYPTLARPIAMRKPAYNQQLSPGSLLVEVGCHGNTLAESLAGARLFARSSGQVLLNLVKKPA